MVEQLYDAEGITLESNKPFAFSCCDCGLTHHMVIVSEDGKPVGFAVKRITAHRVPAVGTIVATPEGDRGPSPRRCTCGSDSPRPFNHALSCPQSLPAGAEAADRQAQGDPS